MRRVLRLPRRAGGRALLHAKDNPTYEKKQKKKTLGRVETDKRTTDRKQTQTKGFDEPATVADG